ncbi:MAG: tRNA 2-thiouridine(34) synthase MnmA [Actinomycetota bacterium]
MRVLAAMSGGVDSAVAASRMVRAGHDVVGVHLALARTPTGASRARSRGCCTVSDAHDARRVSDLLDIPFYVWDFSETFATQVVDNFVSEYAAGRTPNPCLRCNERIKFSALLDRAITLGFDALCTGHYATIKIGSDGHRQLHRAVDTAKDQSYVLGILTADQLERAIFPLGDSKKSAVRAEAAELGFSVAEKPDSHDICFIPDGDTRGWLEGRLGQRPGRIIDRAGVVLGDHDGSYGFTVGQRRGLRIGRPAADGKPRYVLDVQPVSGTVMVGSNEDLDVVAITALHPRWCGQAPIGRVAVAAQVRAHGVAVPATAEVIAEEVIVRLAEPLRGVAPGQAVVLYDGSRVVGSATIRSTA